MTRRIGRPSISQKMGVNDTREGEQHQGIGTPHDKEEKQKEEHANR